MLDSPIESSVHKEDQDSSDWAYVCLSSKILPASSKVIAMGLAALLLTAFVGLANGLASTDTITWGGDNSRAGYQTKCASSYAPTAG